ncbi:serine/threonine protein kinase [Nannocystaceae bacterium ST9]
MESFESIAAAANSSELGSRGRALGLIDGRFEVLARIGMGATGSVYKAFDRTLDRHVAIKVLEPGHPQAAAREAQTLARIRHRHVVAIHDYGIAPDYRYLVLELLVGRDLRRWLSSRPSVDEILARFLEAGRGLAAAHAAGLVHRDFKPSNLIITDEGRAVIIDFGLARNLDTLDGESTIEPRPTRRPAAEPSASNSLAYLAPEHFAREAGDERCDQFAFCVMLWEALSGENPFHGDEPISRYQSIARGPGVLGPEVPNHVARALRRGLSLSPDDRFSSMVELLEQIEHAPSSAPRRRRRPLLSAMLVAATFALGWGLAPDPVIEHAVSDETFNAKSTAAFVLVDSGYAKIAAGQTVAAKDAFDVATDLILDLEEASPPYCRFAAQIEDFADSLLAAGDLPHGRPLYTRAIKFARDCDLPRADIERLEGKKRSSREAFLATKQHEPELCLPPPTNQSTEKGESFQWSDAPPF